VMKILKFAGRLATSSQQRPESLAVEPQPSAPFTSPERHPGLEALSERKATGWTVHTRIIPIQERTVTFPLVSSPGIKVSTDCPRPHRPSQR
jgi:hypothetical protein